MTFDKFFSILKEKKELMTRITYADKSKQIYKFIWVDDKSISYEVFKGQLRTDILDQIAQDNQTYKDLFDLLDFEIVED